MYAMCVLGVNLKSAPMGTSGFEFIAAAATVSRPFQKYIIYFLCLNQKEIYLFFQYIYCFFCWGKGNENGIWSVINATVEQFD